MRRTPHIENLRQAWAAASRRRLLEGLLGISLVQVMPPQESAAKKKKKKLTICQGGQTLTISKKKKKAALKQGAALGPCPPTSPPPTSPPPTSPPPPPCVPACNGKECGDNGCGGSCGTCESGGVCQIGQCVCLPDRVCGEVCCPEVVDCFDGGCACEELLCSCDEGANFCSPPDFDQCCLADDTCHPQAGCVTAACIVGNEICSLGEAFCGAGADCLCAASIEGAPFCADVAALTACPDASQCATSADCNEGAGEACVDVWCCDDGVEQFGMCLTACPPNSAKRTSAQDRFKTRKRLQRILGAPAQRSR